MPRMHMQRFVKPSGCEAAMASSSSARSLLTAFVWLQVRIAVGEQVDKVKAAEIIDGVGGAIEVLDNGNDVSTVVERLEQADGIQVKEMNIDGRALARACEDHLGKKSGATWSDGTNGCDAFALPDNADWCADYGGHDHGEGSAQEACCTCGGGDQGDGSSNAGDAVACADHPGKTSGTTWFDGSNGCDAYADNAGWCADYGGHDHGEGSAQWACCTCGGGDQPTIWRPCPDNLATCPADTTTGYVKPSQDGKCECDDLSPQTTGYCGGSPNVHPDLDPSTYLCHCSGTLPSSSTNADITCCMLPVGEQVVHATGGGAHCTFLKAANDASNMVSDFCDSDIGGILADAEVTGKGNVKRVGSKAQAAYSNICDNAGLVTGLTDAVASDSDCKEVVTDIMIACWDWGPLKEEYTLCSLRSGGSLWDQVTDDSASEIPGADVRSGGDVYRDGPIHITRKMLGSEPYCPMSVVRTGDLNIERVAEAMRGYVGTSTKVRDVYAKTINQFEYRAMYDKLADKFCQGKGGLNFFNLNDDRISARTGADCLVLVTSEESWIGFATPSCVLGASAVLVAGFAAVW